MHSTCRYDSAKVILASFGCASFILDIVSACVIWSRTASSSDGRVQEWREDSRVMSEQDNVSFDVQIMDDGHILIIYRETGEHVRLAFSVPRYSSSKQQY